MMSKMRTRKVDLQISVSSGTEMIMIDSVSGFDACLRKCPPLIQWAVH